MMMMMISHIEFCPSEDCTGMCVHFANRVLWEDDNDNDYDDVESTLSMMTMMMMMSRMIMNYKDKQFSLISCFILSETTLSSSGCLPS